jgi:two-component system OmpR family response regulator
MRVLLAEDEPEMAALLTAALRAEGLAVDVVSSVEEGRAALSIARYRLVVLDRRLDDGDGLELLRDLGAAPGRAAVLVLSALDDAGERVVGLNAGADDYLGKPFDSDELRARIRAALRRCGPTVQAAPIRCGRLAYLPDTRELMLAGEPLELRRREAALLEALMQRVRRVVQRATLINEVYGFDEEPASNTMDAHISRLRRKLDELDAQVQIHAVRGIGYVLDEG